MLHELCKDLLQSAHHGDVQIDTGLIDSLLDEIRAHDLRRRKLQAMWNLADADGWLADAEAVVLNRAGIQRGMESNFMTVAKMQEIMHQPILMP